MLVCEEILDFVPQVSLVLFTPHMALPTDPIQIELIRMLGTAYMAASVSMLALKARFCSSAYLI